MITVGLTGGIGSGKTTVCRVWEELGAKVIYADLLARRLMVEDVSLKSAIRDAFGADAYSEDGSLNRAYLASQAFGAGRSEELNRLVHPFVGRHVRQMIVEAERDGYPMFVEEAALLLLNGRPDGFDRIVVVVAPDRERLRRVMLRDGIDEQDVRDRMQRQQSQTEMMESADIVIRNDSTESVLKQKARELFSQLLESSARSSE